ncbi:hypothetical protein [Botrimarina sp.]|uniref:hypothetical protein n=1 Tax=Botrimarina sp. TaxID=2795802 RepID=UPI0032EF5569
MAMTEYLGQPISKMLEIEPFKSWPVQRIVEDDFEERLVQYVFEDSGLEVQCDGDDRVRAIFMYSEKHGGFDESLLDFSLASSREQVLAHLGTPSRSGEKMRDPIIGECGAWDRFDYTEPDLSAHFEYELDGRGISKFTLMRGDVVPGYRS